MAAAEEAAASPFFPTNATHRTSFPLDPPFTNTHRPICASSERMYSTVLSLLISDTTCALMASRWLASHCRRSTSTSTDDSGGSADAESSAATPPATAPATPPATARPEFGCARTLKGSEL